MLNNAKLKETLSQKVTATVADMVQIHHTGVAERTAEEMILPSLTVVLTFSLPFQDAPAQMKRISEMVKSLGLQPMVQPPTAPALASVPTAVKPVPIPSNSQIPVRPAPASPEQMTAKQKKMIYSLIARKNLSPESVSEILQQEFGHGDGAKLTKAQASKLIDKLMAGK